jgi:hypothetical protein
MEGESAARRDLNSIDASTPLPLILETLPRRVQVIVKTP